MKTDSADVIVGNVYDKYGTKNPIARALMRGFLGAVTELYASTGAKSVLEVGCGEGHLAQHLVQSAPRPERFEACDLRLDKLISERDPLIHFREASVYELPYPDGSFELVVCCEVLEHLDEPERGLAEICRVASRAVLLSTPREPLWRALNLLRGKYLRELGNTPGHVQHFGAAELTRLAERHLDVSARRQPIPWTVLLGHKRG